VLAGQPLALYCIFSLDRSKPVTVVERVVEILSSAAEEPVERVGELSSPTGELRGYAGELGSAISADVE